MSIQPNVKKTLLLATAFLALGVLIGAFGAHGLKNIVSSEKLVTFETGVRYHFYHALGLLLVAILQQMIPQLKLNAVTTCLSLGIIFFSFNCYLYVLTGIKLFALIVPVGGFLFVGAWGLLFKKIYYQEYI